jgi:hypothetical protein
VRSSIEIAPRGQFVAARRTRRSSIGCDISVRTEALPSADTSKTSGAASMHWAVPAHSSRSIVIFIVAPKLVRLIGCWILVLRIGRATAACVRSRMVFRRFATLVERSMFVNNVVDFLR